MSENVKLRAHKLSGDFIFGGMCSLYRWNAGTDSIADLITYDAEEGSLPKPLNLTRDFTNRKNTLVAQHCYDIFANDIFSFSNESYSKFDQADQKKILIYIGFHINGCNDNSNFEALYNHLGEVFIGYDNYIIQYDKKDRWKFI